MAWASSGLSASTSITIACRADVARVTIHGSCFANGDGVSILLSARTRSVRAGGVGIGLRRADHTTTAANNPNAASQAPPAIISRAIAGSSRYQVSGIRLQPPRQHGSLHRIGY